MAARDKPSWRAALLWLVCLGVFFYASYGFANWLAAQRANVPSIVFSWEQQVMFMAWTIVPYWTTNLFYAASFFLCRTREELASHGKRLLTAQVVSVTCFLLFPLKFSLAKPDTSGAFGFLFDTLGAFDKPFNQAPSLHVALTIILAALYFKILPRRARIIFALWSALVVVSVMTTYQHHFIDIPTGALLGLFCVWLWPDDGKRRLAPVRIAKGWRMTLAAYYGAGAALFAAAAVHYGHGLLWLLWPAFALLCVSLAYLVLGQAVFDKKPDGRMGLPTRVLLLPYLAVARANSRLWTLRDPRKIEILEGVHLGRFPAKKDLIGIATVVDLTSEFARPDAPCAWKSFPMLDLVAPEPALLILAAQAVEQARAQGPVLVNCALGHSRSVATLAVWLVRTNKVADLDAALALLRSKRPNMNIGLSQLQAIKDALHD